AEVAADRERVVQELRNKAIEVSDELWLEKVALETAPQVSLEALRASSGLVGELLRHTEALKGEPEKLSELAATHEGLAALGRRLRTELEDAGVDLADPATLVRLLGEAESVLAQRLTVAGGGDAGGTRT